MWFCRRRARAADAPATVVVTDKTCLLHHAKLDVSVDRITMANAHRCSELVKNEFERPERLAALVGEKGALRVELDGVAIRDLAGAKVSLCESWSLWAPWKARVTYALERVHSAEYCRAVWHAADEVTDTLLNFDERIQSGGSDTQIGPHSYNAAIAGATAVLHATDEVLTGRVRSAFAAVRPPGHHVGRSGPVADDSLGFCLFNNAATAAAYAAEHYGASAVVVDFDVHQANGTQDCLEHLALDRPDLDCAVFSVHAKGEEVYPTAGQPDSEGPTAFNFSMPEHTEAKAWKAKARRLLRSLVAWLEDPARADSGKAKLLVLSAGFDAHEEDKSGLLTLDDSHFTWITFMLRAVAVRCSAKIVSMLEGGYTYLPGLVSPLACSVHAHVAALNEAHVPREYQEELRAIVTRKGLKHFELADDAPYVEDAGPAYCTSPTTGDRRSPRIKRGGRGKENSPSPNAKGTNRKTSPQKPTGTKSPKRKASATTAS